MKHKQSSRQISALERILRNVEDYKRVLSLPTEDLRIAVATRWPKKEIEDSIHAKAFLQDKISKAEKCIENLKAKGITLGEKK